MEKKFLNCDNIKKHTYSFYSKRFLIMALHARKSGNSKISALLCLCCNIAMVFLKIIVVVWESYHLEIGPGNIHISPENCARCSSPKRKKREIFCLLFSFYFYLTTEPPTFVNLCKLIIFFRCLDNFLDNKNCIFNDLIHFPIVSHITDVGSISIKYQFLILLSSLLAPMYKIFQYTHRMIFEKW